MDEVHPARMMVAGADKSGARAKLEGSADGQRWWVLRYQR